MNPILKTTLPETPKTTRGVLGAALKTLFVCCFVTASGLGYIWQKSEIYKLGQRQKQSEARLEQARRRLETRAREYAEMSSPRELDSRVKKMNMGLILPQPNQIVRMMDEPKDLGQSGATYYAGESNATLKSRKQTQ